MTFFRKKTKHWDWRMTSSSSITEITQSSPQLPLISWTQGNYDYICPYVSYQYHNMMEVFITKHARVDVWHSDNKTNKQHRTVYQLPDSVSMFVGRIWTKLSLNWLSVVLYVSRRWHWTNRKVNFMMISYDYIMATPLTWPIIR